MLLKESLELYSQIQSPDYQDIRQMKLIKKALTFCQQLHFNNIEYLWCIKHPEVVGCDESKNYYYRYQEYLGNNYSICKHLLLREKNGKGKKYLVVVDDTIKIDLKQLAVVLGSSKLEFCTPLELDVFLGTTPGNISIFNLEDDVSNQVELTIDSNLFDKELLAFHPLYNGMSIFLTPKALLEYLTTINRSGNVIDVPVKTQEYVLAKAL